MTASGQASSQPIDRARMFVRLLQRCGLHDVSSHALVTSSLWGVAVRLTGLVLTMIVGVQLARYLGPAGLGIYGLVLAVVTLLSSFAQLGLPMLATRELSVAKSEGDAAKIRGVLLWFGTTVFAAGCLLALLFAGSVTLLPASGLLRTAAHIGAFLVPVLASTILIEAELRGLGLLVRGQALDVLARPASISALLLLAGLWTGGNLSPADAIAVTLTASLFTLFLGLLWLKGAARAYRAGAPSRNLSGWLLSGRSLAATEVLRQLDSTYGIIVLGILATTVETGLFRVAVSTMIMLGAPRWVLDVTLAPTMARLHAAGDKAKLQRLLTLAAAIGFAIACATLLFVAVAGRWVIVLLFGLEFAGAWQPLLIVCAAQVLVSFFGVGWVMLMMTGGEGSVARYFLASAAVSIAASIPLSLAWGASGAALSTVLGALVRHLWVRQFVLRSRGLDTSIISVLPLLAGRGVRWGRNDPNA